ncbi:MAG: hypothetical protein ACYC7D_00425 [Nitrososphaerales archaeon]
MTIRPITEFHSLVSQNERLATAYYDFSILGGVIGAIVISVVAYAFPLNGGPFIIITFTSQIGLSYAIGLGIKSNRRYHNCFIFGIFTRSVRSLRLESALRGLTLGEAAAESCFFAKRAIELFDRRVPCAP